MKDTEKSLEIMYSRLNKVYNVSLTGWGDTRKVDSEDYTFFRMLWVVCDNIKEWDKLVEKYIKYWNM